MQYFILHDRGYKFTENVQDLTRIQMAYLTKATEIHQEIRLGGGSEELFNTSKKNGLKVNNGSNTGKTLRGKVKQRREEANSG